MALLAERAGVDAILVGDSCGMVVAGMKSTVPVTMEQMIYHCSAVSRAAKYAMVIGDLPFLSYQTDVRDAIYNAGRLIKEGGADVIKLEGGQEFAPTVRAIVKAGIPVVGISASHRRARPWAEDSRYRAPTLPPLDGSSMTR
jgi:3-methyl-2-oxobutanoate hydroxymethyltransferase